MKHVLTDEEIDSVETEVLVDLIGTQFDVYRAIEAKILEKIGDAQAWQVSGPYERQAFAIESSAISYNRGLNEGFGESAYSIAPLYAIPFIEGEE